MSQVYPHTLPRKQIYRLLHVRRHLVQDDADSHEPPAFSSQCDLTAREQTVYGTYVNLKWRNPPSSDRGGRAGETTRGNGARIPSATGHPWAEAPTTPASGLRRR